MFRLGRLVLAVAAAVAFSSGVSEAKIWKFDFGRSEPTRQKVMAGFTGVTVKDDYDKAKGYGWVGAEGETKSGWLEERTGMAGCERTNDPDDLAGGYVAGDKPFALDVPNGKYVVWVMVGDWGAYEFYPRGKYTVLAQGKTIGELDHSTPDKLLPVYFRHRDDEFVNGADLFEKYVEPRFPTYKAEVEVTDGQLKVLVRPDSNPRPYVGPMNGLVVFPVEEKDAGEAELKAIKAARKAQFEKKHRILAPFQNYIADAKGDESARGFIAWTTPYGEAVELWDRLSREADRTKLSAMVSLGEMEPAVVCVHPFDKKGGKFTCTVTELAGDKGDKLPASAVGVKYVKPWEMVCEPPKSLIELYQNKPDAEKLRAGQKVVVPRPYFLIDRNWMEVQAHTNRQFWLTITMPEAAKSLVYTATVTIEGPQGKAEMPLTVTVVPVKLDRAKQAIGLNYGDAIYPHWWPEMQETAFKLYEKDFKLMYDYGMTTVAPGWNLPKDDKAVNWFAKGLELYKKVGFEREYYQGGLMNFYGNPQLKKDFGSPIHKEWVDAFCKVFRDQDAVAKKIGQKVIFSIGDETTNDGNEGMIIEVGKVARKNLPDLLLISDINGYRELTGLAPNLNACGFNNGWGGSYQTNRAGHQLMTRDVIERVKSLGSSPWFINGGKGRYPFGIWYWKTTKWGVDGKIEWHYNASTGDPYNPFDGTSLNDFGSLVLPDQVTTVTFELCREGIDDLRYLNALEKLVAENAKSADPFVAGVVKRAKEALNYHFDCVDDRFQSFSTADGAGQYSGEAWTDSRLAQMRREVAGMICMLKNTPVAGLYDEVMLADGEDKDRREISGVAQRAEGHATHGKYSYALVFKEGKGYADQWGRPATKDWRGYRTLVFDVENPENRNVTLALNLKDQVASNLGDAELRHVEKFVCKPGKNTFKVSLLGMKASGTDYTFDMGCLFSYFFVVENETQDVTLYLDNMRLVPKAE
jgi:hypothetical protein